jgi:hypothetical protein
LAQDTLGASGASRAEQEKQLRSAFERALTGSGTDVLEGHRVWTAFRAFETGVWQAAEAAGPGSKEARKARENVVKLFRRQLSVPLRGNEAVEAAWREFLARLDEPTQRGYKDMARTIDGLHKAAQKQVCVLA